MKKILTDSEVSTLQNICQCAADKYGQDAALFLKLSEQDEDDPFITREAAERLSTQFYRQELVANRFMRLLAYVTMIAVDISIIDPEDEVFIDPLG